MLPSTESINSASVDIDTKSVLEIVSIMSREDRRAVDAVYNAREQIEKAIMDVTKSFREGGRLFYVGAGTSGRLGVLDASECPPTFGVTPDMVQGVMAGGDVALRRSVEGAEDDEEAGRRIASEWNITKGDILIGITASGMAAFVKGALSGAKDRGAKVWLMTCSNPVERNMDLLDGIIMLDTGPEIIAGSTRLKAGTATKLVLNMITTISMIQIGKVYGNLMVDVNPTNNKLKDRARRIISQATGCSIDEAGNLLEMSGNRPKVAIIMRMKHLDRSSAEAMIASCGGFLRDALK